MCLKAYDKTELKGRVSIWLCWDGVKDVLLLWKNVWKKGLSDQRQDTEARSFFITLCTVFL